MGAHMKIKPSLKKKLDRLRMVNAMDKAMTDTCRELRDRLSMSPTPKKTGNLRRSNSYEVRRDSNMIEGLIKNSANYWQYVNFGTSKINAVNFVDAAIKKVEPKKSVAKHFHENYKE